MHSENSCICSGAFSLTGVFVLLRTFEVIDWSIIWVVSPLWVSFALMIIVYTWLFMIGGLAQWQMQRHQEREAKKQAEAAERLEKIQKAKRKRDPFRP